MAILPDMEAIMEIAKKHNLFVIEDNAQAIGNDYTFSEWNNKKNRKHRAYRLHLILPFKKFRVLMEMVAQSLLMMMHWLVKLKMIASHGQSKKYYHDVVGCNSRLDTIQAVILDIKLKATLDEYIAARRKAADYYDAAFANNKKIQVPFRK